MKTMIRRALSVGLFVTAATVATAAHGARPRPEGPCDIYAKAGTPCVAAHSTVRRLYAGYDGPLYEVKRASDGRMLDIGVVKASKADAGGYADAAAQDTFCAKTLCVMEKIYDQTGKGNDLLQAAPGTFKGPAKGGFDTQPIADMAPITIGGHKAYGVYVMPGMGFRNNNASGIAINDEAEGIYTVVDGTHYDSGCCFDYGNSSTNGRAVGTGTMETTYFGTSTAWGKGVGAGPWIMSDMEAGLFSGHGAKENAGDPKIDAWRFVTAVMDGGSGNHWDLRGGDAQRGKLTTFYSGERPAAQRSGGYAPMHKQGGILLGTGGDNGNGSSGTFYEGAMTSGFPTEATTDAVQANLVAAHYDVGALRMSRVTTFAPGSTQDVTATYTNSTGAPVRSLRLSVTGPTKQWTATADGTGKATRSYDATIAPGASVTATFHVSAPTEMSAGFLTVRAEWKDGAGTVKADSMATRVRDAEPVKINEVRFGTADDASDQFVELYNDANHAVDVSRWSLVSAQSQWTPVTLATIPTGTKIEAHGFYLLGMAQSGLAAAANAGDATIFVRSNAFGAGEAIDVDGESRVVAAAGSKAAAPTMVFVPVSTGPRLSFAPGTTQLPVASTAGFAVGEKAVIDLGGSSEIVTVTAVGKAATQTTLATAATAGSTRIQLATASDVVAGDTLTISTGARKEMAQAMSVSGNEVELAAPLTLDHAAMVDVSDAGTGIRFTPATRFAHASADAVQALGSGVQLDRPLARSHAYGAEVRSGAEGGAALAVSGYRGEHAPNQWFGSMLSSSAGSLALMDASGAVVVDALVYGSQQSNSSGNGTIASPELATLEGDQGGGGCIVAISRPEAGSGFSVGRYPDGADTDSNCKDFHVQAVAALATGAAAGASNVKVTSVDGFAAGQTITIDGADRSETATVAEVGTAGATTTTSASGEQATTLALGNAFAFRPGQTIMVGEGAEQETAVVAAGAPRGMQAITLQGPLKFAHAAGTLVAGSGITLTSGLSRAHAAGAQVVDHLPTPGGANQYGK